MYEVKFADIGEGIHEGVIFKIPVNVGDVITDGEILFLVETDKVTAEIPSPVSGTITTIHFSEGDKINVGETIITLNDGSSESVHEIVEEQGSTSVVGDLEISSHVIASSSESITEKKVNKTTKTLATPVARKLAKDLGIDINLVVGSGPAGRVMKSDIYKLNEEQSTLPETKPEVLVADDVERRPLTTIRKAIADNMVKSKFTIPHTAVMDEIVVDELVAFRNEVKLLARQKNVKLTYMPLIIKAVVASLKVHEILNGSFGNDEILIHKNINIGVAVDTPYGLMVPVIKNADQMSIIELAEVLEDLQIRAQSKALTMDEITGSTFTITNYGAFGSSFGVPVINYPNAAILGIGKIDKKPIVKDDQLQIGSVLPLSMSFDHRIVDGADAGRFMNSLKELLMNPKLLVLS